MGNDLVHKLQHLLVTVRLGRAVTHITTGEPVSVQALLDIRPATENPHAPPLDLRFVIDRSGSMSGNKIEAVREALRARDRLSIVTFNARTDVAMAPTKMDARGKKKACTAINDLYAKGDTFISDALQKAQSFQTRDTYETRVVLFTDGQSTVDQHRDHPALVNCSDRSRTDGVPLLIYGTGEDYNHALLIQMAARAGHGSFLKHVMDADVLRGHLHSEVGFLRGVGVRGLTMSGKARSGAQIDRVTRFMPLMEQVPVELAAPAVGEPMHSQFVDSSGALDRMRGQQYLIECTVSKPVEGGTALLDLALQGGTTLVDLTLQGQTADGEAFRHGLPMVAGFTTDPANQSEPDPEVMKVLLMMAAAEQARQCNYGASADLYDKAGDPATAATMRTMQEELARGRRGHADVDRGSQTVVGASVTVAFTRKM